MDFKEFVQTVSIKIQEKVDAKVCIQEVTKNNNNKLMGLTILEDNINLTPTVYLNYFYNDFIEKKSIDEIVEEIITLYKNNKHESNVDFTAFLDYSQMKNKVVYKLVNYYSNKEYLQTIPHVKFLDLAIVFYLILENEIMGIATVAINNKHLEMWGISDEEVYEDAKLNTPKLLKAKIESMENIIIEIIKDNITQQFKDNMNDMEREEYISKIINEMTGDENENLMYVLTNTNKMNGASCMMYDGCIREFAGRMKKDLIIIPSSIHEVILMMVEDNIKDSDIREMVKDINETEVESVNVLSDNVYRYNRATDTIEIA